MNNQYSQLAIEPSNTGWWTLVAKTFIWSLVWVANAALIFIVIWFLWNIFEPVQWWTNPILPILMMIIAFLCTFIGGLIISWFYSLFYSKIYYDSSKMISLWLIWNVILFIIFLPIYLIFYWDITWLYYVLAFHILFSVFAMYSFIEFSSNPNYAWSHMIWTMIWFAACITTYTFINTYFASQDPSKQIYFLMLMPPVLSYTLIPFWHNIREKIYYKFYEVWNNFLYIPSLSEVLVNSDDLNNWEWTVEDASQDINVE